MIPPLNLPNLRKFMSAIGTIDIRKLPEETRVQLRDAELLTSAPYVHGQVFPNSHNVVKDPTVGVKLDQQKPRMDLLDFTALEGLADVLTFGANKYAAHNWRGGLHYSRVVSSLLRHISAIQRGEYFDPESGKPHIDHIGCNWMFLSAYMKNPRYAKFDDLYKEPK